MWETVIFVLFWVFMLEIQQILKHWRKYTGKCCEKTVSILPAVCGTELCFWTPINSFSEQLAVIVMELFPFYRGGNLHIDVIY